MNNSHSLLFMALATVAVACSDDIDTIQEGTADNGIAFAIDQDETTRSLNDNETTADTLAMADSLGNPAPWQLIVTQGEAQPVTRVVPATQSSLSQFVVNAWLNRANGGKWRYIDSEVYAKGADNVFRCQNAYYWPNIAGDKMTFVALAPAVNFQNVKEDGSFYYQVASTAASQSDVLWARVANADCPTYYGNRNKVPLQFKHLMTQVHLRMGTSSRAGTVTKVEFYNVLVAGTYDGTKWIQNPKTANFTCSPNQAYTPSTTTGTDLTPGVYTFMMLPQTLPANAELRVTFHDNATNADKTVTVGLADMKWEQGKVWNAALNIKSDPSITFADRFHVANGADTYLDAYYVMKNLEVVKKSGTNNNCTVTIESCKYEDGTNCAGEATINTKTTNGNNGYWVIGEQGSTSLNNAVGSNFRLYLTENISGKMRLITLKVKPQGSNDPTDYDLITLKQEPAIDCGNIYTEYKDGPSTTWGYEDAGKVMLGHMGGPAINSNVWPTYHKDVTLSDLDMRFAESAVYLIEQCKFEKVAANATYSDHVINGETFNQPTVDSYERLHPNASYSKYAAEYAYVSHSNDGWQGMNHFKSKYGFSYGAGVTNALRGADILLTFDYTTLNRQTAMVDNAYDGLENTKVIINFSGNMSCKDLLNVILNLNKALWHGWFIGNTCNNGGINYKAWTTCGAYNNSYDTNKANAYSNWFWNNTHNSSYSATSGNSPWTSHHMNNTSAVVQAMKCNQWRKKTVSFPRSQGQNIIEPVEIKWFLPAVNELPVISTGLANAKAAGYPNVSLMSGTYWSSTAAGTSNASKAYAWGTSAQMQPRSNSYKVRAARKK